MKWVLVLLFLVCVPAISAATLYGNVYSLELDIVNNVVVEINTTPSQRDITEEGVYSFEIGPGSYQLKAFQYENGELVADAEENITITDEGEFLIDLILFPSFEAIEDIEDVLLPEVDILAEERDWKDFILILIALIALFVLVYYFRILPEEQKTEKVIERIDQADDLDKIIKFIRKEGGRTTQKDLRRAFPYSEGKMSLMIAELEDNGKIKKIKKGRGNILILK